ncbi:MAG: hypothetical protein SVX43_13270, partial [Cyanobacteriota bacterium]|nr:hypothetical protein [Cyanobacteriota bacterium]
MKNQAEVLPSPSSKQATKPATLEQSAVENDNSGHAAAHAVAQPELIQPRTQYSSVLTRLNRWKRRSLWSLVFILAAGTSAVGGAAIALLAPLPEGLARWFPGAE